MDEKKGMVGTLWWVRQVFFALCAFFFLFFGIHVLIAAYSLKDPFSFVMTFFSSNLIILISLVLLVGFVYGMITSLRKENRGETHACSEENATHR